MMTSIFRKLLYKESLANYIDDFVILVKTKEELEKYIISFLKITEKYNLYFKRLKYNLYFKRLKYNFNTTEIPILGVQVRNRKV